MIKGIIFLLQLSLLLSSTAVIASSCDCPEKDVLSQSHCGPVPAALISMLPAKDTGKSRTCPTCNDYQNNFQYPFPWTTADQKSPVELEKIFPDPSSKDKADLNTYLNCNRENSERDQKRFCHFKDTLSPLIELAAKSGHQPYSVQACLFKRESEFNSTARSPVGAKGYIQFMSETITDNSGYIRVPLEQYKKTLDEKRAELRKLQEYPEKNSRRIRNALDYLRGYYGQYRAKLAWDKYWAGTQNPPQDINVDSVHCQNVAFAAAMVKQTVEHFLLTPFDPLTITDDEMPRMKNMDARETGVFLAGGYNAGLTGLRDHCRSTMTLKQCIQNMSIKETHKHMLGINACSEKNNWNSLDNNRELNCKREGTQCSN